MTKEEVEKLINEAREHSIHLHAQVEYIIESLAERNEGRRASLARAICVIDNYAGNENVDLIARYLSISVKGIFMMEAGYTLDSDANWVMRDE